jgi:2'-hydroxyisoflavone reductase
LSLPTEPVEPGRRYRAGVRILIIGGTVFLGRALATAALGGGHDVTLFNRGTHPVDFGADVEQLRGDRTGDLEPLRGRRWDAVIDTCGYAPSVVRRSAQLLADAADRYAFVSSVSVFRTPAEAPLAEDSPLAPLPEGAGEEVTNESYGPLKALCEAEVRAAFGGRALVVRPGMIVGPHDPTDRFLYWPVRMAAGGPVLAPGRPDRPVRLIDARDLAAWMLELVERGRDGTFIADGPAGTLTMGEMLDACGGAPLEWVDDAFLLEHGVEPWSELPFWLPDDDDDQVVFETDISRALAEGLRFRPLADTVADLMAWHATRGTEVGPPTISRDRERELLAEWHSRG